MPSLICLATTRTRLEESAGGSNSGGPEARAILVRSNLAAAPSLALLLSALQRQPRGATSRAIQHVQIVEPAQIALSSTEPALFHSYDQPFHWAL